MLNEFALLLYFAINKPNVIIQNEMVGGKENPNGGLEREIQGYILKNCIDSGNFYFKGSGLQYPNPDAKTWFSKERVNIVKLLPKAKDFSELLAAFLKQHPTGGLICDGEWIGSRPVDLLGEMKKHALADFELPITTLSYHGQRLSGVPLEHYSRTNSVSVMTMVNTLGGTIEKMTSHATRQGLTVERAIALVDRTPKGMNRHSFINISDQTLEETIVNLPVSNIVRVDLPIMPLRNEQLIIGMQAEPLLS